MSAPLDLRSPLTGAAELARHQRLLLFAELVGREPDTINESELTTLEAEFQSNKTVLAIAEANSWRAAGELRVLMDRILQVMAGQAVGTGLYAYHPDGYSSVAEGLKAQLAQLEEDHPGGSKWNDLDFITNVFVPMCAAANKNGYEELWRPGTLSKSRLLADYLRSPLAAAGVDKKSVAAAAESEIPLVVPAALEARVSEMLTDATDPKVSVRGYKKKHGENGHAARPPLQGYHFNLGRGGATVIFWSGEADRLHLEQAVHADFHLGTGAELARLTTGLPTRGKHPVSKPPLRRLKDKPIAKVGKRV